MAVGSLQMVEGDISTAEDFLDSLRVRYTEAVGSGCYSEMTPAEFTLVTVPAGLMNCDTTQAEADQMTAASNLDMDARRDAYNLMLFAIAEPINTCSL